jgi:hypothetical protein
MIREREILERQILALKNPAIVAEDCAREMYKQVIGRWSTILTLNSGFE